MVLWMKRNCGMVAVQLDGEDYLVVIGGTGDHLTTILLNNLVLSIVVINVMRFIITSYHQVSVCVCVCNVCVCVCVCVV